MSKFRRFAASVAEGFLASRYRNAMDQMNDHQLAAIGVTRETISRRALELAQKR